MPNHKIITIDLNFQGLPGAIATYLVPHKNGAVLVETGPSTTLPALQAGLAKHGYQAGDITDVLLTHIHLDHAGAAGWLARQGAHIYVHKNGAPHLVDPEKLLSSAARIYGDQMESLWGEFLPVPETSLTALEDNQVVEIEGLRFRALDTPGHASHHLAYLFEEVCFSGDIGGVRVGGQRTLRLPMPPPELNIEKWRESLQRLGKENIRRIAPTHFGIYTDPDWQLANASEVLNEVEQWLNLVMPSHPDIDKLRQEFAGWMAGLSAEQHLQPDLVSTEESVNPAFMSADGLFRYWRKYREEG